MKYIISSISILVVAICIPAQAAILNLSWSTTLNVDSGMEGQLPNGVSNGQSISGGFIYDTDFPFVSASPDGQIMNYDILSWNLKLGTGNEFGRAVNDGLGVSPLGRGWLRVTNNDDAVNDRFQLGNNINPNRPPENEYLYTLTFEDTDSTVWDDATLPDNLIFDDFEITKLSLYRVVLNNGNKWSFLKLGDMSSLDTYSLTSVPLPGALFLFISGLLPIFLRKRLLKFITE